MPKPNANPKQQGATSRLRKVAGDAVRAVLRADGPALMRSLPRFDGWANLWTGLGVKGVDKSRSSQFFSDTLLSKDELDRLYRFDGISKRIINRPVGDMLRKDFIVKISQSLDSGERADPEQANKTVADIKAKLNKLQFNKELKSALRMSRIYGGAIVLLGLADGQQGGQDSGLSMPVDEENLQDLRWVKAVSRHQVTVGPNGTDVESEYFGQPLSYAVRLDGREVTVHASRVLRFDGESMSAEHMAANGGFGDSVLQSVYEALCDYHITHVASAALVQDFSQPVFRVKDLAGLLAANGEADLLQRVILVDRNRSIAKMAILDAETESLDRVTTNVAGLDALLDRAMLRLSATSGLPMSLLYGMSPRGFATEDKSGRDNWNEVILAEQEDKLAGPLHKLVGYVMRCKLGPTGGNVPDSWSIEFESLEQPSDRERAELELIVAQKDAINIQNGVISASEVMNSRYTSEGFQLDTHIDREARDLMDESAVETALAEDVNAESPAIAPAEKGVELQKTAFNGAQISSLVDVAIKVRSGELGYEEAVSIIVLGFNLTEEEARRMISKPQPGAKPAALPAAPAP